MADISSQEAMVELTCDDDDDDYSQDFSEDEKVCLW